MFLGVPIPNSSSSLSLLHSFYSSKLVAPFFWWPRTISQPSLTLLFLSHVASNLKADSVDLSLYSFQHCCRSFLCLPAPALVPRRYVCHLAAARRPSGNTGSDNTGQNSLSISTSFCPEYSCCWGCNCYLCLLPTQHAPARRQTGQSNY